MTTLLIGFDSAWTAKNSGALIGVLCGDDSRYVEIGPPIIVNYAEAECAIDRWNAQFSPSAIIQFIDQPTIVKNVSGQRPVENIVGCAISRRYGGMQPASRSRTAMFDDDAPIWLHLDRVGGPSNLTEKSRGSGVIETYPALAIISLGWTLPDPKGRVTGRLPKYNPAASSRFSNPDWQHVCVSVSKAFADRKLPIIANWILDRSRVTKPRKHDQDALDACICLLVGLHFVEGRRCLIVGNQLTGYILVPHNSDLQCELEKRCDRTNRVATEWVRVFQPDRFEAV